MKKLCYVRKGEFNQVLIDKIEERENLHMAGFIKYAPGIHYFIRTLAPDIILFDVDDIPEYEAGRLVEQLKKKLQAVKIIVITSSEHSASLQRTLKAEIDSLVMKDSPDKIIRAINSLSDGRFTLPDQAVRILIDSIIHLKETDLDLFHQRLYENNINLSVREAETAYFLKQGLKNRVIAEKLQVSEGTVKVHISRIYHKLNIKGRKNVVNYLNEIMLSNKTDT